MNILEREIAEREARIQRKSELVSEIELLVAKTEELKSEEQKIDVDVLKSEIEEIKSFLPKSAEELADTVSE